MKQLPPELYKELLTLTKKRNKTIHKELLNLPDAIEHPAQVDTLALARETKSQNKIDAIKKSILTIASNNTWDSKQPTKYQVHKETGIAYATINKYYDNIIKDL